MPPRTRRSFKPKRRVSRPKRKSTGNRKKSTGQRLINKPYSYLFKPDTQWLSSNALPGEIVKVGGAAPLGASSISTPFGSATGFANYYDFGVGMFFTLKDLANVLSYTSIYDQYRINWVDIKITYLSSNANITGVGVLPTIFSVTDNDNSTVPGNERTVRAKQGSKAFRVAENRNVMTMRVRPKAVVVVDSTTGVIPALQAPTNGWLDCIENNVVHYGIKFWIDNVYLPIGTTTNTALQFEYTYNVSFRGAQNLF